ncbi:uncharacterized protein LOC134546175 [Bacillus rossius redtenbacheri]|uniref:uncharacterized protein LOC134546175 n=1 Tax=Bacillus rossius redtenbacheri TaxID=93214 RepID=UPI002FDDAB22
MLLMDFCSDFAILQGTLISAQRNFGSLNSLTKDDAVSTTAIVDATKNVLQRISKGHSEEEKESCLRKVNMFLVLNSDLSIRDYLMDDINCGHIVGCTPVMSMHLLMELVWGLSLQKYFFETVMFSPAPLGVELLAAAADTIKLQQPNVALGAVDELCRSAYIRALTLPSDQNFTQSMLNQLFVKFKTLLHYFHGGDADSLRHFSNEELHVYAGQTMERLLNLLNFCLARYLEGASCKEFPQPVYDLTCPWNSSKYPVEECEISMEDFNKELLTMCKNNLNHITVDEWLEWVEFAAESDSTKTQQCVVAEKMYECKECLCSLEHPGDLVRDLTAMLTSMARKPRDEEDEIRDAGMEEIVQNVSSPSKSRSKWLKALLRWDNILGNELTVACLENNLDLVDTEDIETILHLVVSHLERGVESSECDRFKRLALEAVRQVDIDTRITVLEHFLGEMDLESEILLTSNFRDKATEAFNKGIVASEEGDKLLSDCAVLCLESPRQVVERLLGAGLASPSQGRMAVRVLGRLGVACDLPCAEGGPLLLRVYLELVARHCDWPDAQRDNFTRFVAALVKRGILDGSVFVRMCLLPALHTSLVEKRWSSVLLWLQTLQPLVESENCELNAACLLVFMAQVVELSQWNVYSFSLDAVLVHEKAVHLQKIFVDALDASCGSEVKWVLRKLQPFPARAWSYLSKVWDPWTCAGLKPQDLSILLLYLAHGGDSRAVATLQTTKYTRLEWVLGLVEVVPTLTPSEWNLLTENLSALNPGPLAVFHLISDALLFVFTAVCDAEHKAVVSCVEYLIRNIAAFVKNFVLPIIDAGTVEAAVQVFEKCTQLLTLLPATKDESTVLQFSNVLAKIISVVMCSNDTYAQRLTGAIDKLHDGELKQVLTMKLQVRHVDSDISDVD